MHKREEDDGDIPEPLTEEDKKRAGLKIAGGLAVVMLGMAAISFSNRIGVELGGATAALGGIIYTGKTAMDYVTRLD